MSSQILLFLEHDGGSLSTASLSALAAAQRLSEVWSQEGIAALCLGPGAKSAAEAALSYGVSEALFSEDALFENYRAVPYAAAFEKALEEVGAVTGVAASSSTGKDFMPRAAAKLQLGQASDIIAVNNDGSLKRPMYAGDVLADVEILTERKFVTVRASAFDAAQESGASGGEVRELTGVSSSEIDGEFVGFEGSGGDRPDLGDASVVVSGGRALQSSENFEKIIFPLADSLKAAVGASRAAVDSGYAPNDWQVGQTGKIVAPELYIAIGISGAIQHLAGMKDSKVIVAINKDEDAPIFEVADYGLVADLYEVVPELTEKVQAQKS